MASKTLFLGWIIAVFIILAVLTVVKAEWTCEGKCEDIPNCQQKCQDWGFTGGQCMPPLYQYCCCSS
uniref:Uncharacterized protein n=1 Tax=Kalanchoe fedtschenkoi TaxID=63787 RepID=A0A7N1A5P3_KALFE